jgi:Arc/MetJ family transcription regulator
MQTIISIDEDLVAEAMAATGQSTKEGTVEEALRRVVRLQKQKIAGEQMAGFGWEGDIDSMREGRIF